MTKLNDASAVKAQYASSENLSARISLHAKYSTNKQGFGSWIAGHYRFAAGASVLELGCGTGEMWLNRDGLIQACSQLILSDLSEGMLAKAKETLQRYPTIRYAVADIQEIPFPDDSFDAVIANMMLYHVPDIDKGLAEVRRVLRDGGAFYCATYGEHGMMEHLSGLFKGLGAEDVANHTFTLQNGAYQLRKHFAHIRRFDYEDSLEVTDVGDVADYIYSLTGMSALRRLPRETILSVLNANAVGGVLTIPKEYGLFVSE